MISSHKKKRQMDLKTNTKKLRTKNMLLIIAIGAALAILVFGLCEDVPSIVGGLKEAMATPA